jgi:hypothetical protein
VVGEFTAHDSSPQFGDLNHGSTAGLNRSSEVHRMLAFGGRSGRLIIISKVSTHDRCCRKKCGSVGGLPLATHPWPNGNFLNHARLRRFDLASTSQDTTSNRSYFLSANSGRTARAFAIALALAVASSAANIVRTCSSPVADRRSLTENTVLRFIYCSFFHASSLCRSYHIAAMSAVTSTFGDSGYFMVPLGRRPIYGYTA